MHSRRGIPDTCTRPPAADPCPARPDPPPHSPQLSLRVKEEAAAAAQAFAEELSAGAGDLVLPDVRQAQEARGPAAGRLTPRCGRGATYLGFRAVFRGTALGLRRDGA